MTKELKNVIDAIHIWANKNKGNASFIAEFVSFKDKKKLKKGEDIIRDDFTGAYGDKKIISIMLEDSLTAVKKSKENFINW